MDPQHSHYHFGEGAGNSNPLLPVSAFSAYSLLRNCNYLLTTQTQDAYLKPFRSSLPSDFPGRTPVAEESEKSFLNFPPKNFLTSSTLLGYPHHIHMLPNEQIIRSRSPNNISPCSSIYGSSSNFKRQRGEKKPIPDEQKDDKYFERRRRNNQAAKKSRDARKIREDQIALKATILEHENAILRAQVLTLREEASSLRQMLLQKKALELASRDPQICIS